MTVETDPTWMMLCADAITTQIGLLKQEGEGAIAQRDVENVHRMRVASRRIRAALDTFEDCVPADRAGSWRKEIRRITRALGAARDVDVQIGFLKGSLPPAGPKEAPGIDLVLRLKTKERARLQPPLVDALQRLEERGVLVEMLEHFKAERERALANGAQQRSPIASQKAWERTHVKVEELVEHEACVHVEQAMAEHHAMRISAKRLRYALEMVRPLFDDGLEDEIAQVKKLQDLLGDLHDCDVWVQDLGRSIGSLRKGGSKLTKGTSAESVEPGMAFLMGDRARRRKEIYVQFVEFWDKLVERRFVVSLLRKLEAAADQMPDLTAKAIDLLVTDPSTKVAVIGDVHGNLQALQAVLEDADSRGAEVVLNAGDLLGYGANPEEAVVLLRSRPSISVIGNYDLKVFRIQDREELWPSNKSKDKLLAFRWAFEHVSPSSRAWLRSLPKEVRMEVGGKELLMVHGSPDSMDEHLGPETPVRRLESIAEEAKADVIIMGHSHKAFSKEVRKTFFLNPGSVGRPDDGDPRASYAMLQLHPYKVSLLRVAYDVKGAARAIKEAGLPKQFAKMLLEGRAYDRVVGKEEGGRADRDSAMAKVRKVARSYLGEDPHSEQVARLSMMLFDGLSERMGLGADDRYWLECAAVLHDIGWSEGQQGHHKTSLRMILEEEGLPFDVRERKAVGSIARYHRKALPSPKHAHFSSLSKKDRARVMSLAAILRLADALDCSHGIRARSLRCELSSDRIILHCSASGGMELEEREVLKKGDLIRKVLGLGLEMHWELER
ncbi:MAG: YfcE family phosphodiesterase [Methanomassiliicoccales archaeon]|nr:YfcE family phosphodiesterase [Methanomassiliicoccales archaeon]